MAFQLLLNVLLAVCWMFLTNSLSTAGFITGFIAGLAALFFFPALLLAAVLHLENMVSHQTGADLYKGTIFGQCQRAENRYSAETEHPPGHFRV